MIECKRKPGPSSEQLLDFCSERLQAPTRALVQAHLDLCPECREQVRQQLVVASALDQWQVPELSSGFNRELWAKLDAEPARSAFPAWLSLSGKKRFAFPAVALVVALALFAFFTASFQPGPGPSQVPVQAQGGSGVDILEAEQAEQVLEDLEMLDELASPAPASGTASLESAKSRYAG